MRVYAIVYTMKGKDENQEFLGMVCNHDGTPLCLGDDACYGQQDLCKTSLTCWLHLDYIFEIDYYFYDEWKPN